jgi:membrane-associated phospholipid phosphatase
MDFRRLLRRSALALVVGALLVTLCYFFVDARVAFFVHDHQVGQHYPWLKRLTFIPIGCEVIAAVLVVVAAVRRAWGPLTRFGTTLLAASVSLMITLVLRDYLKYVFGRYWPETWIDNNPSLIRDHAYGFHPFHEGVAYSSFPSGHTARIFAFVSVLWLAYPKGRLLYLLVTVAAMAGLVGMDYHFVGDVVGGAFLGALVGTYAAAFAGLVPSPPGKAVRPNGGDEDGE